MWDAELSLLLACDVISNLKRLQTNSSVLCLFPKLELLKYGLVVMAMLLRVHTEFHIRTGVWFPCNTLVSSIGHNGQFPGSCSLWAGFCVLVLNSYMTEFVEYQQLHLYQWWKADFIKYFWTLCQKCPTNESCWAASRVGDFDYQADRKYGFVIKFLMSWATSLENRQYAWLGNKAQFWLWPNSHWLLLFYMFCHYPGLTNYGLNCVRSQCYKFWPIESSFLIL